MDFKWIEFLIEWILNGLDHRKNGLDHKNWIFCPPLIPSENSWDSLIPSKIFRDDLIPSDTPYGGV